MNINRITVTAGRTFNHPYEQYSNLRPEVTMEATLSDGEDATAAAKTLQQQTETLVEDHKTALLTSIEALYQLNQEQSEMRRLGEEMQRVQSRLDEIRSKRPQLAASTNSEESKS